MTESVLKVRSFMRDILASLDLKNVGWKMVYNFLGNEMKPRIFFRFSGTKYNFMHFERRNAFQNA